MMCTQLLNTQSRADSKELALCLYWHLNLANLSMQDVTPHVLLYGPWLRVSQEWLSVYLVLFFEAKTVIWSNIYVYNSICFHKLLYIHMPSF